MFDGLVPLIVRSGPRWPVRKEPEVTNSKTGTPSTRVVALITAGALAAGVGVASTPAGASPHAAAATAAPPVVVSSLSTTGYGRVLVVGSHGPYAGYSLYLFSGDAGGKFGCGTKVALGFDVPDANISSQPCTGPAGANRGPTGPPSLPRASQSPAPELTPPFWGPSTGPVWGRRSPTGAIPCTCSTRRRQTSRP